MASMRCPSCASETSKVIEDFSPHGDVVCHQCDACKHMWVVYANRNDGPVASLGAKARTLSTAPSLATNPKKPRRKRVGPKDQ